jgi:uncharacterized membrane protein (UPF0127 family)
MRAVNRTRGCTLATSVTVAARFGARLRGLMGRPPLAPGAALLLRPCSGIHTFFVRGPIDVLFLDADHRVVAAVGPIAPFRCSRIYPRAEEALELAPGTIAATGTAAGDLVALEE